MIKKNFLLLITTVIFSISTTRVCADTTTINGSATLKDTKFENLIVNGSLDFNNLDIKKDLKVNGSVSGNNLECNKFKANGSVTAENIKVKSAKINGSLSCSGFYVKHKLEVAGELSLTKGDFHDIKVMNTITYLSNCKVKNILIKKIDSDYMVQKLELNDGTIVSNDVIFESGNGEIYLSNGSVINGKIKGATVIKK